MTYFTRNQGYPFGVDLSQHNASWDGKRIPDFNQFKRHEPEVQFVAMRTGISWGYRDSQFAAYFTEAKRVGLCIMPYHVLYPVADAKRQMDAFLSILEGANLAELRLVLDVELAQGKTRWQITDVLAQSLEVLKQATGRYPIVYSRALWINEHLQVEDLPQVDWWLAQYIRSLESLPAPAAKGGEQVADPSDHAARSGNWWGWALHGLQPLEWQPGTTLGLLWSANCSANKLPDRQFTL